MLRITSHPHFIKLSKIMDSILDSRIWKWIYWIGIGVGGLIFMLNIYDIICVLFIDGYEFRVKKITSNKEAIFFIFNSIIIFALPCFISFFARTKYFYKIVGILLYLAATTELQTIFYPNQYYENITILAIITLSLFAMILSRILKFNDNREQNKQ
jgi:hypothetical protein